MVRRLVSIYALAEPHAPYEVRYIGKSTDPERRLYEHVQRAPTGSTWSARWIQSLLRADERPLLIILERTEQGRWAERERWWVASYRRDWMHEHTDWMKPHVEGRDAAIAAGTWPRH